jgi:hypothetical protein
LQDEELYEGQYHGIEISRGSRGFGFSIRGGREFQNMALFVLQIAENGPAALDGRLKVSSQFLCFYNERFSLDHSKKLKTSDLEPMHYLSNKYLLFQCQPICRHELEHPGCEGMIQLIRDCMLYAIHG